MHTCLFQTPSIAGFFGIPKDVARAGAEFLHEQLPNSRLDYMIRKKLELCISIRCTPGLTLSKQEFCFLEISSHKGASDVDVFGGQPEDLLRLDEEERVEALTEMVFQSADAFLDMYDGS
ncbi:hypothetical protein [Solirhodobacter olei]|uniref:hypothetical protein n=1 Tax=Solirhodobacter olei TaxID=2493082 RepID=UPI000FD8AF14|nr:hypothetical protein [Solirhodobacter olei]